MDVDASVLGDGLVVGWLAARCSIRSRLAEHQPEGRLAGALAAHADTLSGGGVASGIRLADSSCEASRTHLRPLIVDWTEGERAALEAVARRQLVVVRYEGCELEVLRGCRTKGDYEYVALTPKRQQISMRDRNELSATLPLGAAHLGGELETSGELSLDMTTVGLLESNVAGVRIDQLEGQCAGATHVVSALAVGAFELSSGSSARVGANAGALGAGVAGQSESTARAINRDGELAECRAGGADPIPRCDALLRLELLALGEHRPLCGPAERYNGEACEPLLVPVAISDDQRRALQRACKLGVRPACKAAELVGER